MSKTSWAIIYPNGEVLVDTKWASEEHAWQTALGWPDLEEIEDAKAKGYKCVRVTILMAEDSSVVAEPEREEYDSERVAEEVRGLLDRSKVEVPTEEPEEGQRRGRKGFLGIAAKAGTSAYHREYYQKRKEKVVKAVKKWQRENPDKLRASQAKYRERLKKEEQAQAERTSSEDGPQVARPRFEQEFDEGDRDKGKES